MTALPTGTVTFLFTDIQGSTNLARTLGDRWTAVLEEHNAILRRAIRDHGGVDVRTEGDAFFSVFTSAVDAVTAAAEAQRALAAHPWPADGPVRVRMGMHTGEGRLGGDEYVGLDVHRAARVASAGHGGQVLISEATEVLVRDRLPEGVTARDLGQHRLKDFEDPQRISQLVIQGLPSEFPPLKTLDVPTNLPLELTSFIGREKEVRAVADTLEASRLVTLTGPGGTGKTRLTIRVAREVGPVFHDGVFFVDLSPISDPQLVASEIAHAVGITEDPARPMLDTLTDRLRDRRLLLLLDNFEQVIEASGTVEAIVTADPHVRVLVTSRVPLKLYGEHDFQVPPLPLPAPGEPTETLSKNEAVALFVERARAVDRDFDVNDHNAAAISEICTRLDGLPLAIELAASRVRLLTPEVVRDRLRDHLPALGAGPRNVPERQRTLRGAIEWSANLLGASERRLLARLSVFAGGATIPAVERVGHTAELGIDTLEGLEVLTDHSLLRLGEEGSEPRFLMLETIREFAADELVALGERETIGAAHAKYFVALAEEAEPHFEAEDMAAWFDRCEREHDNFRAALRWAIDRRKTNTALRIGAALWRFWSQRGHLREGAGWLAEALMLPGPRDAVRASAHNAAAGIAYWRTDYKAVRPHYEEALAISRDLGDRRGEMEALFNLGFVPMVEGDHPASMAFWDQSLAIARELEDPVTVARSVFSIGMAMVLAKQPAAALPLLEEGRAVWKELGNLHWLAESAAGIGLAHRLLGNFLDAARHLREALVVFHRAGNLPQTAAGLDGLASVASSLGQHERAVRLAGAAAALKERIGGSTPAAGMLHVDVEAAARSTMGDEAVAAALAEGRKMALEDAVAYALSDDP